MKMIVIGLLLLASLGNAQAHGSKSKACHSHDGKAAHCHVQGRD